MKKVLFCLLVFLLQAFPLPARSQRVRDVDVKLTVLPSGGVVFHEAWDINTGDNITEWYLVRENLGDIQLGRLRVLDETGKEFIDDGEWNVNRTLEEKAGHSGIVHKTDGVELCWGVGPYGDHVFHVFYWMLNALKSLNDYDMLHLQVVSPGLSSPPEHVKVTVEGKDIQLDTTNTRIWGFGFAGTSAFQDGKVVFESAEPFRTDDSVIILLRFNKGMFTSASVQERDFQEALDQALEGAAFKDDREDDDPVAVAFGVLLMCATVYFTLIRPLIRLFQPKKKKRLRRVRSATADWYRDIPLNGNLMAADFILNDIRDKRQENALPLAVILRLVCKECLESSRELEGPLRLVLKEKEGKDLDPVETALYWILKKAAGEDGVLDEKEFSRWAKKNSSSIYYWAEDARERGQNYLTTNGLFSRNHYTSEGRKEAWNVAGFKKYLEDFTLSREREVIESGIWKEYLVYAALFGIADRVARQLKDVDPSFFRQNPAFSAQNLSGILSIGESLADSVRLAASVKPYVYHSSSSGSSSGSSSSSYSGSSRSGYGGHTSRSGGSGYSSGGRGGGGR